MARKTQRKGAGKKAETRHSPLARSLMVHRAYENVVIPQLERDYEAATVIDQELARQANMAESPERREVLRRLQVEHANAVMKGVKDTTDKATAAKKTLKKHFSVSGMGRRKTRRRLRGGQDKYSPLAKRLMTARQISDGEFRRERRNIAAAAIERMHYMDRAGGPVSPEERERLINRRLRTHETDRERKEALLERERNANAALQEEYEAAEDREYATAQALAHKKGGRKTRRKLRGGQGKHSPLAKALAVRRKYEMDVTPEMRERVEKYNRQVANLEAYAATAKKPWELKGIAAARAQLERTAPPLEVLEAVAKADAAKGTLLQTVNDPSVGVPRKRK